MPEIEDKGKYKKIIEESKRIQADKKENNIEEEQIEIVIFSLGNSFYAFYGDNIKSILPYNTITFVPGCPDHILGIINVRGDIESVLNIHKLVKIKDEPLDNRTRIVIAEAEGIRSGILVNSVEDVVNLPVSSITPSVSTIENALREFVAGELYYQNKLVTLFDLGKLFGRISV